MPALCRISSRRSRMRATWARVRLEGFTRLPLPLAELLAARLDPLRMKTIVRRSEPQATGNLLQHHARESRSSNPLCLLILRIHRLAYFTAAKITVQIAKSTSRPQSSLDIAMPRHRRQMGHEQEVDRVTSEHGHERVEKILHRRYPRPSSRQPVAEPESRSNS